MLVSHENVISNGGVYDFTAPTYRQDHWPTLYQKDNLKLMLDAAEVKLKEGVKALTDNGVIRKSLKNLYKNGTYEEWQLYEKEGQLNSVQTIINNMDDYHVDLQHETLIPLAKDNKHFKRISTLYDIRNGRRDDAVYYDYLRNIASTIQRNNMAAELVKAINLVHKSKRIPKSEKGDIINYTVNLFKVPFHSSTVKGFWGESDETFSKKIKTTFGTFAMKYTPNYVTSLLKTIGSTLTFKYLAGFTSPLTNLSGAFQNINDYGRKSFMNALNFYIKNIGIFGTSSTHKGTGLLELITMSGITEFSDFFSRSMVKGITKVQLEQDIHMHLLRAMTKFHKNYKKLGEEKATEIFQESASKILAQSNSYLKAEDIKILEKGRLEQRESILRQERRKTLANKLVQFAIEREYEFKTLTSDPNANEYLEKRHYLKQGAGKMYYGLMRIFSIGGKVSMSNTEKFVRTISFIIGIQRAYDAGLLERKENWWEYTNKKDKERAITIGREFSYFSNFGMSTQAVGSYNYNGLGNLVGKFKYWSQQKAGRDLRIFKEAYRSLKSMDKIEGLHKPWIQKIMSKAMADKIPVVNLPGIGPVDVKRWGSMFDPGAVAKLIYQILPVSIPGRKYQQKLRKENSRVAALRTFMTTQVLMTFIWDVALGGPLRFAHHIPYIGPRIQWVRSKMYGGSLGGQMKNTTSDVASLMLMPFTLLSRWAVMMAFGGLDDDDDDIEKMEKTFTYYLRNIPFVGYLPAIAFDHIMAIMYLATNHNDQFTKKFINATSGYPYIGTGTLPGSKAYKKMQKAIIEEGFGTPGY